MKLIERVILTFFLLTVQLAHGVCVETDPPTPCNDVVLVDSSEDKLNEYAFATVSVLGIGALIWVIVNRDVESNVDGYLLDDKNHREVRIHPFTYVESGRPTYGFKVKYRF